MSRECFIHLAEYLTCKVSAEEISKREGLIRGQIYKWRVQLERRERLERINAIAESEGVSIVQARRIRELEEEVAATQQKLAQTLIENDLLKNCSGTLRSLKDWFRTREGFSEEIIPNSNGIASRPSVRARFRYR